MKNFLIMALSFGLVFGGIDLVIPNADFTTSVAEAKRSSFGGSRSYSRPSSSKPSSSRSSYSKPTSSKTSTSSKPSTKSKYDSGASSAKARTDSRASYKPKSQAAKTSYTSPSGKSVKIDPKSTSTQRARSITSDQYANRSTRVEHHYHTTYGDRYSYYRSQPSIYIGGGYSCLFWYSMLDWNLDRRARWMYHNQHNMDQALYQQQLAENAQLKAQVAAMSGTDINKDYVDSEFKDNPDLMYSDEFVNAAYNPTPKPKSSFGAILLWTLFILLGIGFVVWLVFIKQWNK